MWNKNKACLQLSENLRQGRKFSSRARLSAELFFPRAVVKLLCKLWNGYDSIVFKTNLPLFTSKFILSGMTNYSEIENKNQNWAKILMWQFSDC